MTVELTLIRHGAAEDRRPDLSDDERALTRGGRERLIEVVRGLARLGWELDGIVSSPLLRAVQTAELCRPLLLAGGPLSRSPELARPPGEPLLEECRGLQAQGVRRLALVGHEPWLGDLCGWLAGGEGGRMRGPRFKKATVARLEGRLEPGGMDLLELLPPRVTRALAETPPAS